MKKLILVRHAKAEDGYNKTDFERNLTERGLRDASEMAKRVQKNLSPQYIVSSPANRTKATAIEFAKIIGLAGVVENMAIYEAGVATLHRLVNQLPAEFDCVMLVGHNPGISEILYLLTGQIGDVPTCTVVTIQFDLDTWDMITADSGTIAWYNFPKMIS